jgi:hypothetical protein
MGEGSGGMNVCVRAPKLQRQRKRRKVDNETHKPHVRTRGAVGRCGGIGEFRVKGTFCFRFHA